MTTDNKVPRFEGFSEFKLFEGARIQSLNFPISGYTEILVDRTDVRHTAAIRINSKIYFENTEVVPIVETDSRFFALLKGCLGREIVSFALDKEKIRIQLDNGARLTAYHTDYEYPSESVQLLPGISCNAVLGYMFTIDLVPDMFEV